MKRTITAMLLLLVLLSGFAVAEANSTSVSLSDLRYKQVGESIDDFMFSIRSFFTFDPASKIDLLAERLDALRARHENWLEAKETAMNSEQSSEARQVIELAESQQFSIQRSDHAVSEQIRQIAMQQNNPSLLLRAENAIASSNLNSSFVEVTGMVSSSNYTVESNISINNQFVPKNNLSSDEARQLAESKVGISADNIKTETRDGSVFYVITGKKNETENGVVKLKTYEVWVSKSTGAFDKITVQSSVVGPSGSSSASSSASATGNNSYTEQRTETKTSPDGSSSSSSSTAISRSG